MTETKQIINTPLTKAGKPDKRYKPKTQLPKDLTVSDLPKLDQFIYYQYKGHDNYQAAIAAGYADSTAKTIMYKMNRTDKYRQKCQEYAISKNVELLPKVTQIDSQIIDLINADPNLYPKFKDVPRQVKQVAGILKDASPMLQPMVNIAVQVNVQGMVGKDIGLDDVVDGEVVEE